VAPYTLFTVATGEYVTYARILAKTLREHGSTAPFLAYTDGLPVPEADETFQLAWDYRRRMKYSPERWFVKLYLLKELARRVDGYAVFMDADIYARRPVDLGPLLHGPVSAFLEVDLETIPSTEWINATCGEIVGYMRQFGYEGPVHSLNAGLFAVHSSAVEQTLRLIYQFKARYSYVGEQPALGFAIGLMNPAAPSIDDHRSLYDSNTIESKCLAAVLANAPWQTRDFLSGAAFTVDPALVHYASQKAAVAARLAPQLAPLSRRAAAARLKARLTSRTFGGVLEKLGLLPENEPGAVPRRATV
jgi:hypothetical protein